jgi:signal transduction histidine kinase
VGLVRRITRPLDALSNAAEAVSHGNLDRHVDTAGPLEVQRVGKAFNVMTGTLRSTLGQLADRSAIAAVGEFAGALSHDVRNALTSIKIDLERSVLRPLDDGESSVVLRRALNNVTRLESLVTGALQQARRDGLAFETIDLRRPARTAAEVTAGAFAGVPASFSMVLPDEPVHVRADAVAIELLLANVLFNASQAVRSGGHTTLRVQREGDVAVVDVTDDGIGMGVGQLAQLNKPFPSSRPDGIGLGLPIARQVAAAHGGSLEITSHPGQGTTVRLRLPAGERLRRETPDPSPHESVV